MRRDAKVDQNQTEIITALRQIGASVYPFHFAGKGCPDLIVGFRGHNFLLEVKTERGRLNAVQSDFHRAWRGHATRRNLAQWNRRQPNWDNKANIEGN